MKGKNSMLFGLKKRDWSAAVKDKWSLYIFATVITHQQWPSEYKSLRIAWRSLLWLPMHSLRYKYCEVLYCVKAVWIIRALGIKFSSVDVGKTMHMYRINMRSLANFFHYDAYRQFKIKVMSAKLLYAE